MRVSTGGDRAVDKNRYEALECSKLVCYLEHGWRSYAMRTGIWEILLQHVKELDAGSLKSLMDSLIREESRMHGVISPSYKASVTTPDGGRDGLTFPSEGDRQSRWLGNKKTCWQYKSTQVRSFSYGDLNKELDNGELPRKTLMEGGRYVLCLSKFNDVREDKFLEKLSEEFSKYKDNIKIYGMENIADFCQDHEAVALNIMELEYLRLFKARSKMDEWDVENEHSEDNAPWTENEERTQWKNDIITSFEGNTARHIHIFGFPGVGKTRLAIESCKTAPWKERVLYAKTIDKRSVLRVIREHQKMDIVLVVDEVHDAEYLREIGRESNGIDGSVKLLTIGFHPSEYDNLTKPIKIELLSKENIEEIVRQWYRQETPEFHSYTADLAEGYVRFARMVADALHKERIKRGSMLSPKELLDKSNITGFLDKLIGDNKTDRRALHVCSMLTFFGYRNQYAQEGKIIANKFDMKWSDFVSKIEYFSKKKIVQRTENYFYISPKLLAIYLAKEAHDFCRKVNGDNYIFDLLNELPSEAKKRYCARIAEVSKSIPIFFQEQLFRFKKVEDFFSEINCSLWRALSLVQSTKGC